MKKKQQSGPELSLHAVSMNKEPNILNVHDSSNQFIDNTKNLENIDGSYCVDSEPISLHEVNHDIFEGDFNKVE